MFVLYLGFMQLIKRFEIKSKVKMIWTFEVFLTSLVSTCYLSPWRFLDTKIKVEIHLILFAVPSKTGSDIIDRIAESRRQR